MSVPVVPSVDVAVTAVELKGEDAPFLLDVREPHEFETAKIEGSVLIPLGQLPQRIAEIPQDRPIIVHCHHGGRSARAVQYLLAHGFEDVRNMAGGIEAWSLQIDPGVARY